MSPEQQNNQQQPTQGGSPIPPQQPQISQPPQSVPSTPLQPQQQVPYQPTPSIQPPSYQPQPLPPIQQPPAPRYIAANQSTGYLNQQPQQIPPKTHKHAFIFAILGFALLLIVATTAFVLVRSSDNISLTKPSSSQSNKATFTLEEARNALADAQTVADASTSINKFLAQYNIEFTSKESVTIALADVSSSDITENQLPKLKQAGTLLIEELSKYPAKWIGASRTTKIAILSDLSYVFNGQNSAVAGLAGIGYGILMLNLEIMAAPNLEDTKYEDFARDTVHHELFHMIDWAVGTYNDETWASFNEPSFIYLQQAGGTVTTEYDSTTSPGFVSGYAKQNIFEDKAETYTFLVGTRLYDKLMARVSKDTVLKKKVTYIKNIIKKHAPEMDDAYLQHMSNTKVTQNMRLDTIDYRALQTIIKHQELRHTLTLPYPQNNQ